jgi:hypothetical protein
MAMERTLGDPIGSLENALRGIRTDPQAPLGEQHLVSFLKNHEVPVSETFRNIYLGLPPTVRGYVDEEFRTFAKSGQDYEIRRLNLMLLTLNAGDPEFSGSYGGPLENQESLASDWQKVAQRLRESYGLAPTGEWLPCWPF